MNLCLFTQSQLALPLRQSNLLCGDPSLTPLTLWHSETAFLVAGLAMLDRLSEQPSQDSITSGEFHPTFGPVILLYRTKVWYYDMCFDLFFHTCNGSRTQTEWALNPFTGDNYKRPIGESVSIEERHAIGRLLADVDATGPSVFGGYLLQLADGGCAELYLEGLCQQPDFTGGGTVIRDTSPLLCEFFWNLASVGNLAIVDFYNETFVTSQAAAERVRWRWREISVLHKWEELQLLLTKGVDAWKRSVNNR